jgi:hypothetical protein
VRRAGCRANAGWRSRLRVQCHSPCHSVRSGLLLHRPPALLPYDFAHCRMLRHSASSRGVASSVIASAASPATRYRTDRVDASVSPFTLLPRRLHGPSIMLITLRTTVRAIGELPRFDLVAGSPPVPRSGRRWRPPARRRSLAACG